MVLDNRQLRAHRARHALTALLTLAILLTLVPIPARAAGLPTPATEESAPGPSGAATFAGVTYLYARRGDGAVWVRKTDGLWYSGWSPLGGATDTAPAAASTDSFVNVFVRGQDGKLWANRTRDGLNYDGWQALGESLSSPPAAAGLGGRVHVFTRDAQGMVWERITTDGRTFSPAT